MLIGVRNVAFKFKVPFPDEIYLKRVLSNIILGIEGTEHFATNEYIKGELFEAPGSEMALCFCFSRILVESMLPHTLLTIGIGKERNHGRNC